MGQYTGATQWASEIYQFEETDLVLADSDNVPLQQLADRTVWLKNQMGVIDRLNDDVVLTESTNVPSILSGSLIVAYSQGIMNLTLDSAATFKHGALIPISSFCLTSCVVNVKTQPGQPIFDTDGSAYEMHMHHKEQLLLMALTDHWKVVSANGNFYSAGEEIKARRELINTLAFKGQLVERARYPRLWKYANSLTLYQEIVPESLWFYDYLTYRGCFSQGNGLTTFRLPDERGMSERMIDAGRGIDLSRSHNFPGGYEADAIKQHRHHNFVDNSTPYRGTNLTGLNKPERRQGSGAGVNNNNYEYNITGNDNEPTVGLSSATGGQENIVKNIGKLNLIKY